MTPLTIFIVIVTASLRGRFRVSTFGVHRGERETLAEGAAHRRLLQYSLTNILRDLAEDAARGRILCRARISSGSTIATTTFAVANRQRFLYVDAFRSGASPRHFYERPKPLAGLFCHRRASRLSVMWRNYRALLEQIIRLISTSLAAGYG